MSAYQAALAACALVSITGVAQAQDTQTCIEAHGRAQELRGKQDLTAARSELSRCVAKSCPAMIRGDCARFIEEIDAQIPTVVFFVRSAGGDDISEAKVFVDGKLVQTRLDGSGVQLNPGSHGVRFELADGKSYEKTLVLREGERLRSVGVELTKEPEQRASEHPARGASPAPSPPPVSTDDKAVRGADPVPYVLAGVGVLGLASFSYFGLAGRSKESDLDACAPTCSSDLHGDYDVMRRDYLIADISLGVGIASLAGAAVWMFVGKTHDERAGKRSVRFQVSTRGIAAAGSF